MGFSYCLVLFTLLLGLLVALAAINHKGDRTVKLFQEYIRINSTTNSNLAPVVKFWRRLAQKEELPFHVYEFVKGYPVIVIKWTGIDSSLSSVMLNSHMDVVPADNQDGWTFPPFSAHITKEGYIYGRGTQDMKCVSIQHFEAMRRITARATLLRDVYMTLMPDEETGGLSGMVEFIKTREFTLMNVGLELDEGWASESSSTLDVFVRDKAVWQFRVDCTGTSTHGSFFFPANATAVGKCLKVINALYDFREEQYDVAQNSIFTNAGGYTSVNLNILNGGSAVNVIPGVVSVAFDVRLAADVIEEEFLAQLNRWIADAGDGVKLTFYVKNSQTPGTVSDATNPHWVALNKAARQMNITLNPIVSTGATDGRYLRGKGIPALGISAMLDTPPLPHNVDERLNAAALLKGVHIFEKLIESVANLPADILCSDPSVYLN